MVPATAVAVLAPLTTDGSAGAKVATAGLNLLLGVAIGSLVAGTGRGAMRAQGGDDSRAAHGA